MKKQLAALLVCCLLLGALSACAKPEQEGEPAPTPVETPSRLVAHGVGDQDSLAWQLDSTGRLFLRGNGEMQHYEEGTQPWAPYAEQILSLEIAEGVDTVGAYAFSGCYNLKKVKLPTSLLGIAPFAFYGCPIEELQLPPALQTVGEGAFMLANIRQLNIPASLTSVGATSFMLCVQLEHITVDKGNMTYSAADGVLFTKDGTRLLLYPCERPDAAYTVPDGVTVIVDYAFAGAVHLQQLTLSQGVDAVGYSAFASCGELREVDLPEGLRQVGNNAFANSTQIAQLQIPVSVEYVGPSAFDGWTKQQTLTVLAQTDLWDGAWAEGCDAKVVR